jgi:hypothetical protein
MANITGMLPRRPVASQCMEKPMGPIGSFFPELFKLVSRRVKNQRWLGMVQVGFQEGEKPALARDGSSWFSRG